MRILVVIGLLVLAAAFVVMRFVGDTTVPTPPQSGDADTIAPRPPADSSLPAGTVAANVDRQPVVANDLADEPTACLLVLDHASARPLSGAALRRVRDGAEIGFTDERGLADVPLRGFEQLAVVADGYLLRLAPTRPGSTADDPQRVQMVFDTWSPRVRLQWRADGAPVREAFVRFRPVDATPANGNRGVPVPADDAVLQRAWTEHTMLAGRPVCGDVAVELGVFAPDRVHRIGDGTEVRFVVPGAYTAEVASIGGLVARRQIEVRPHAGGAPPPLVVELRAGVEVNGVVTTATNAAPIAGTTVTLQGGDPLGLVATTGADGSFRLAPLIPGALSLHVRHGDHEPRAVDLSAPASDVQITLQPLPRTVLRGRVRRRPDLTPIAGAVVAWQPNGATTVAGTTAADGTFLLHATGSAAARLAIQAPGYRAYAELVAPGTPFADYDVWPDTRSVRLDHKLTAVLAGVVLGSDGAPLANVAVRWRPAAATRPIGMPGRRVLDGAGLELPLVTTTGPDGSFLLETEQLGAGTLSVVDVAAAEDTPGASLDVDAAPGATIQGLRLRR